MKNILNLLLRHKPKSPKPRPMIVPSPAMHSILEKTKTRNQLLIVSFLIVVLAIVCTEMYIAKDESDNQNNLSHSQELGIQHLRSGNYAEAATFFRAKLMANPNSLEDKINLAFALKQSSDVNGAEKLYLEIIRAHPSEPTVHNNFGVLLSSLGRHDEAEKEFQIAWKLDAQYIDAALNLAINQENSKKYSAAIETYHKALKLSSLRTGHEKFLQERVRLLQAVAISQESRGEKL